MVERASDPRREWNVHLILVIIIIRVVMWLAPPDSTPPNKMRPLSREFSLFGEIEKWRLSREGDQFDVIIDTTDGGGWSGAAPNSERQSNQRLIVSACEILQLPRSV